jgi:hypothetical protein
MISGSEALGGEVAGRTDGLHHHVIVLATRRHVGKNQISNLTQHLVERNVDLVLRRLRLLDHVGELLGTAQQRGTIRTVGLRDLLAERLLFRPELFEVSDRVATRFVCLDQVINQRLRLATGPLRGP